MILGYARVSTTLQSIDTQIEALKIHGVDPRNIYQEQLSANSRYRPELDKVLKFLIKGDTLVVYKLDRLARSLEHLLKLFREFEEKGIDFVSITEKLNTNTPTGKMHFQMIGVFSEFERNLISERTKEGLAIARKNGKILGRQEILNSQQKELIDSLMAHGKSKYEIARYIGIKSRTPIYNYLKNKKKVNNEIR